MNYVNNGAMAAMAAALAANTNMSSDKAEMRLYLDRLKAMVPQCPKNRKVSRQEVLEHVINYISDLQDTLHSDSDSEDESPPGSPMDDVSFNDAYSQQPQYGGYGLHPDTYSSPNQGFFSGAATNAYHQPQYAMHTNGISQQKDGLASTSYGGDYTNGYRSHNETLIGYNSNLYSMQ